MKEPLIISVGGGKGGVGKSIVTSNLGVVLAQQGLKVGFIDGDLGGANLHLCLGVKRPRTGLRDFLTGRVTALREAAVETAVPNTWLISGASDILELANPRFAHKQKIISNLKKMDADIILVDLGAGSDNHVSDFFSAFRHGIVVCDGLPTSVENAYGFLKNGVVRGLTRLFPGNRELQSRIGALSASSSGGVASVEGMVRALEREFGREARLIREWLAAKKTFLVLNMVKDRADIAVGQRFREIVKKYVGISLHYIGYIHYEPDMRRYIRSLKPAALDHEQVRLRECFTAIARNLQALAGPAGAPTKDIADPTAVSPVSGKTKG